MKFNTYSIGQSSSDCQFATSRRNLGFVIKTSHHSVNRSSTIPLQFYRFLKVVRQEIK